MDYVSNQMAAKSKTTLVQYVHDTWLIHKEKIIRCWTDRILHFGTTSTSRSEGNHFVIKRILGIVNNDLLTVFNKILTGKENIETCIGQDSWKQYKKLIDIDDGDECTGLFSNKSVGVPCRLDIKRRIEENGRFNIDDIHCQWHLHAPPAVLPVDVHVEPFSFPRKNLMQYIKRRLYEADDDQAAVVMARLDEASQKSLQPLSNPELSTKRGSS
ncbi:hypothetical protein BASA50_003116 [Batrachochytrium salamandrivorans]|uniref:Protein FAR1-RELATED SEQUENCE n=1 Tax=Batrachochytrium salamandrivorans TaxID=1357716 RepID=A0ABQ8FMH3_9FUNG|nr:hypothetical protein BASA50_003116 [Batrachochytrium salamandrivorans]